MYPSPYRRCAARRRAATIQGGAPWANRECAWQESNLRKVPATPDERRLRWREAGNGARTTRAVGAVASSDCRKRTSSVDSALPAWSSTVDSDAAGSARTCSTRRKTPAPSSARGGRSRLSSCHRNGGPAGRSVSATDKRIGGTNERQTPAPCQWNRSAGVAAPQPIAASHPLAPRAAVARGKLAVARAGSVKLRERFHRGTFQIGRWA
jgi:hypothetical protein